MLLAIYLFSNFHLIELVKIPMLIEHYGQHQKWNQKSTFIDFIVLHYQQAISGHSDYDLDKKLPFLSGQDHIAIWVTPIFSNPTFLFQPALFCYFLKRDSFHLNDRINSSYLSGIWQPPKYCWIF